MRVQLGIYTAGKIKNSLEIALSFSRGKLKGIFKYQKE